jgi:intergrase/recombinase
MINQRRERDLNPLGVTSCESEVINNNKDLWKDFEKYLISQGQSKHTIRNKLQYTKRFYHVLNQENAKDLLNVSLETRQHAMKSLASLSKYLGIYDKWQDIKKRYQLKWSQQSGYSTFEKIFNNKDQNFSSMIKWIKNAVNKLPREYGNLILFATLTGLRPDESYKAIDLIKTQHLEYVNDDVMMHYKYPKLFLRVSKKAYLSVGNEDILQIARNAVSGFTYSSLRKKFQRHDLPMNMYYCRKVFATFLRNNGIEQEIIDLLQGRTPSSIFVNHYYRPDIKNIITNKVKPVLNSLYKELLHC